MASEPQAVERRFPGTQASPRSARRFVRDALDGWRLGEVSDDVLLIAGELCTNAVVHACSSYVLRLELSLDCLRVVVEDASGTPPQTRAASPLATGGRGLSVVEALSARWGWELRPGGKTVWVEISVTPPEGQPARA